MVKKFGAILAAVGVAIAIYGFSMDTTYGFSHNIGLLEDRQNVIIIGSVLFLGGIILFGFGSVQENRTGGNLIASRSQEPKSSTVSTDDISHTVDDKLNEPNQTVAANLVTEEGKAKIVKETTRRITKIDKQELQKAIKDSHKLDELLNSKGLKIVKKNSIFWLYEKHSDKVIKSAYEIQRIHDFLLSRYT